MLKRMLNNLNISHKMGTKRRDLIDRLIQPEWKFKYFKFITTDFKMFTSCQLAKKEKEIMFYYECKDIRVNFSIRTSLIRFMDNDKELESFLNGCIKGVLRNHV